jgi:hypothetical protein
LPTPQELVARSALIVHARVEGLSETTPSASNQRKAWTQVRFRVLSVLKGKIAEDELVFDGEIERQDDWNERPVPYDFIRRGGRRGNCYAIKYRQGGEYLLLLNRVDPATNEAGGWSPYWTPLGPTNEQVRGASDPWLRWVAQRAK